MRARPDASRFAAARAVARREVREAGRPTRDTLVVLAVFLGVVALWLTETWHGMETGIIALGGAVALALLGRILPEDLGRISWASLLTFHRPCGIWLRTRSRPMMSRAASQNTPEG